MNTRRFLLALGGLVFLAASAGASAAETRIAVRQPFDSIDVSGAAVVRVTQGASEEIVVEGDEEIQGQVQFEFHGRSLQINPSGNWKFWNSRRLSISVTVRDLKRLSISGAADFVVSGPLKTDNLTVDISGSGSARFDQLQADELKFTVSGSGDGQVRGSVDRLRLRISGRSEFRGENLKTQRADVSMSGVGDVKLWVTQELAVSVSGVGTVDYWGSPTVRRSVSGAATLNDRGPKR